MLAFSVQSFAPTDTGFVAQFNQPLTTSELNLYDQGGVFGAADVTLVGTASGNARGSLVVNAAGDAVTFVKTGGLLANDTYTVTLRSAANAFHEGANLLDGNADGTAGDDFVAVFARNVAAGAVTASLPDFARGPGQVVDVWNAAGQAAYEGIPVLLSTGVEVREVEFTLQYDPALLTIDAVKLGTGVAAGTVLSFDQPSTGTIQVSVANANTDLSATAGKLALVSLLRADGASPGQALSPLVPLVAPYGRSQLIGISDLTMNGPGDGVINTVADSGIHVVAYAGELSGNGAYNAPDTSFAQQIVLRAETFGLAEYPLVDPIIIADINANGIVQANDVAQIQRLILGLGSPFVQTRVVVARHAGVADPESEGWGRFRPFTNVAVFPVVNDVGSGIDAWAVDDNGLSDGVYGVMLSSGQVNQAMSKGWTLRAFARVVNSTDPSAVGTYFLTGNAAGEHQFGFHLILQPNGTPAVLLLGLPVVLNPAGLTTGYHLYELTYDPVSQSASFFIDGDLELSGYAGITLGGPKLESTPTLGFGSGAGEDTGHGNYALVEFEIRGSVNAGQSASPASIDLATEEADAFALQALWGVLSEDRDGENAVDAAYSGEEAVWYRPYLS